MHPFPALGLNMGLGRGRNMANLLLPRFQPDSGASAVLVDERGSALSPQSGGLRNYSGRRYVAKRPPGARPNLAFV